MCKVHTSASAVNLMTTSKAFCDPMKEGLTSRCLAFFCRQQCLIALPDMALQGNARHVWETQGGPSIMECSNTVEAKGL